MSGQATTQAIISTQNTFNKNQKIEQFALFDADGNPLDLSGVDKHFEQDFTMLESLTVEHNLGKMPAVTIIDTAGDECFGDVFHVDRNDLVVTFSAPTSGTVICN